MGVPSGYRWGSVWWCAGGHTQVEGRCRAGRRGWAATLLLRVGVRPGSHAGGEPRGQKLHLQVGSELEGEGGACRHILPVLVIRKAPGQAAALASQASLISCRGRTRGPLCRLSSPGGGGRRRVEPDSSARPRRAPRSRRGMERGLLPGAASLHPVSGPVAPVCSSAVRGSRCPRLAPAGCRKVGMPLRRWVLRLGSWAWGHSPQGRADFLCVALKHLASQAGEPLPSALAFRAWQGLCLDTSSAPGSGHCATA